MCIICVEYNKNRFNLDEMGRVKMAQEMIAAAKREPNNIPKDHLKSLENEMDLSEAMGGIADEFERFIYGMGED